MYSKPKICLVDDEAVTIAPIKNIGSEKDYETIETDFEKAFKQLERKFNIFMKMTCDLAHIADNGGNLTFVNDSMARSLGYTKEEMIGMHISKFFSKETLEIFKSNLGELATKGEIRFKSSCLTKNGDNIDGELKIITFFDNNGNLKETMGIFCNTSVQKHKNAEFFRINNTLNAIFNSATEFCITATDLSGNIASWNKGAELICGYTAEEMIGKMNISQLMAKEQSKSYLLDIITDELIASGVFEGELNIQRKNGEVFPAYVNATLLKDEAGTVMGLLAIVQDITKKKQAEKEINQKNKELLTMSENLRELNLTLEQKVEERTSEIEKLLKHKDEFINQLGHDLKTPLTPLLSLLPLVEEKEADQNSKEFLEICIHNVDYIKNLVISTIQLAKINSKDTTFDFNEICLFELADSVLSDIQTIINDKGIKIQNKIDGKITVLADVLRLREVFVNLLTNSIKFTESGGLLSLDAKENDDEFVTILIKDTGIGLGEEEKIHLFEEFYKADQSRHELESSGLGLTICKRIVEKHGGKIWAESPGKGKGTTFYFTIPKKGKR